MKLFHPIIISIGSGSETNQRMEIVDIIFKKNIAVKNGVIRAKPVHLKLSPSSHSKWSVEKPTTAACRGWCPHQPPTILNAPG